mmetsp:Transcript_53507/g.152471  ORF Transcript_53507/g.152471 Transcript_53507/m.152471 type:complete len:274 (+) Transcript_53507:712-1533(+)
MAAACHDKVFGLLIAIAIHIVAEQESVVGGTIKLVDIGVHALALKNTGRLEGRASIAPVQQRGSPQPPSHLQVRRVPPSIALLLQHRLADLVLLRQVPAHDAEGVDRPAVEVLLLRVRLEPVHPLVVQVHKAAVAAVHAQHDGDLRRGHRSVWCQPCGRVWEIRKLVGILPERVQGLGRKGENAVYVDLDAVLGAPVALRAAPRHGRGEGAAPGVLPVAVALLVPHVRRVQVVGGVRDDVRSHDLARGRDQRAVEEHVGLGVEQVHDDVGRAR